MWVPEDPAVLNGAYRQLKKIRPTCGSVVASITMCFIVVIFIFIDAGSLIISDILRLLQFYVELRSDDEPFGPKHVADCSQYGF